MMAFSLDILVRALHLLATITWVGGLIYTNFVLSPPVTGRGVPPSFIRLMCMQRFKWFAAGSLAVLLATGAYNALRGLNSTQDLVNTPWGTVLLIKLIFVGIAIIITAFTGFVLGPMIVAKAPKPGPGQQGPTSALVRLEKHLVLISQINLACALVIIYLAIVLRQ